MRVVRASGMLCSCTDLEGIDVEGTDLGTHLKKHKSLAWSPELEESIKNRNPLLTTKPLVSAQRRTLVHSHRNTLCRTSKDLPRPDQQEAQRNIL